MWQICEVTSLKRLVLSTENAGIWSCEHARRRSSDLQVDTFLLSLRLAPDHCALSSLSALLPCALLEEAADEVATSTSS